MTEAPVAPAPAPRRTKKNPIQALDERFPDRLGYKRRISNLNGCGCRQCLSVDTKQMENYYRVTFLPWEGINIISYLCLVEDGVITVIPDKVKPLDDRI